LDEFRAQKRGGKGLQGMATKDEDFVTTLFVANTHTPLLFFTTDGMVYKLKTWRLPSSGRTARGKAIVNILPIASGVSIAAVMPVDRVEDEWDELQVIFATSAGTVRRNRLSDFANVKRNGKIAMKLEGDHSKTRLINARICSEDDDIMLSTTAGRAIRFRSSDVRVFNSRASVGVRGILLRDDDQVVSMSVIRHFEASPDERTAYLKMRRLVAGVADDVEIEEEEINSYAAISQERYAEMSAAENLLLTITVQGAGKLSSSHDYPLRGRGGQGVMAMDSKMRGGPIISSFPVELGDQVMLATSTGQSIRVPIEGISFRSRSAGGVRVFNTSTGEEVVSVAYIADQGDDESEDTPNSIDGS
jgi:DNA gyrase subunit A